MFGQKGSVDLTDKPIVNKNNNKSPYYFTAGNLLLFHCIDIRMVIDLAPFLANFYLYDDEACFSSNLIKVVNLEPSNLRMHLTLLLMNVI